MGKAGTGKRAKKLVRAILESLTVNDEGAEQILRTFKARYLQSDVQSDESADALMQSRGERPRRTGPNCEADRANEAGTCTMEERDTATENTDGTPDLTIAI